MIGSLFKWLPVVLVVGLLPWGADAIEDREALLAQADALEAEGRVAEVVALLEPHSDGEDGEVLARLAVASLLVATDHMSGAPTPASIQPAVEYARRAADSGDPIGWNVLWIIHSNGMAGDVEPSRVAQYLRAGAAAGEPGALVNLLEALYRGSAFFDTDVEEACAVYDRLEETENHLLDPVVFTRAEMRVRGQCGLEADPPAGFEQWRGLAEGGFVEAQRTVGLGLLYGWVSQPDYEGAADWFERAAAQGDGESMWLLGQIHLQGQGVASDEAVAAHWFQQGADMGHPPAVTSLAVMYASGSGVAQDFGRAKALYEQAVRVGDTHALRNLAVMHVLGQGTPPDPVQARVYYLQHRHAGHQPSPEVEELLVNALDADGQAEAEQRFQDWLALQDILSVQ